VNAVVKRIDAFLQLLLEELDISDDAYNCADETYRSIGKWLERGESSLSSYSPRIYPQGSFLLGTVTDPVHKDADYDIDLVCELQLNKQVLTQRDLKELLGREITAYATANGIAQPHEGRRCWTLKIKDGSVFHVDILPAVPDSQAYEQLLSLKGYDSADEVFSASLAIAITDRTKSNYDVVDPDWLLTNPKGYYLWFKNRMMLQFEAIRKRVAESLNKSVDEIPDHKIKTPLQRAIQILKRHRDALFRDRPEIKPISIIITTLAARAYDNEESIIEALISIARSMHNFIENHDGVFWVSNPVNPSENFADRWSDDELLPQAFRYWISVLQDSFIPNLVASTASNRSLEPLQKIFGADAVQTSIQKIPPHSGLKEVSLVGCGWSVETVEITNDLFCKTLILGATATVGQVKENLNREDAQYCLLVNDAAQHVIGLITPEHISDWESKKISHEVPALILSDSKA